MCHARFNRISIATFFIGEMLKIEKEYFYDNFLGHRASSGIDFIRKPERQTRVHYYGEKLERRNVRRFMEKRWRTGKKLMNYYNIYKTCRHKPRPFVRNRNY